MIFHIKPIFLILLLHIFGKGNASNAFCNREDPNSCAFGGTCHTPNLGSGIRVHSPVNVCSCPIFDCIELGIDPVCGSDGRTYVNTWCRRQTECSQQRPIEIVCKGICGPTCKNISSPPSRCKGFQNNFCLHFGECLENGETKFCNCLPGYTGLRCENLVRIGPTGRSTCLYPTNEINYKLAFLCTLGLFGMLLFVLLIVYTIKCYRRSVKNKASFEMKDIEKKNSNINTTSQPGLLETVSASLR